MTENHHGDNRVARHLLKPRRRAQIEVWLDETMSLWEAQYCSAGRLFGHRSDLFTPAATGQPSESPRSTPVDDHICPVCGRSSEGEGPSAHPPGKNPPLPPIEGKPGRGKYMLRGIRAAMGQFRSKDGSKSGDDDGNGLSRAASTAMFLAEASEDDSSVATAFSSSGPFGGKDGKAPPDERKALEERMARLMRAQKLLDRSQTRH